MALRKSEVKEACKVNNFFRDAITRTPVVTD